MPIYPYSFQLPPLNVQDIPNDGAPGEFLGISAGGALDWLPVATGGGDMLKSENLSGLTNYATARTNIGLGTGNSPQFTGLQFSTDTFLIRGGAANLQLGAADAATPVAQTLSVQSVVAGTTNTAGAAFTIDGSQGTGTGAGGSLIFRTAPAGSSGTAQNALATALSLTAPGYVVPKSWLLQNGFSSGLEMYGNDADALSRNVSSSRRAIFNGVYFVANSGFSIGWTPNNGVGNDGANFGQADTILVRDGVGTLALRNGAAAQTFRVYNTYTDASNYERGEFVWSGSTFYVQTINLGTGQTRPISFGGQSMAFRTNSGSGLTERMAITSAGNVGIGTTSPSSKLHVEGGQILVSTGATDGVPGYAFSADLDTGINFVSDGFGNGITFIVNSTRKLTVQNNRILAATNLQITGTIQPERATMVDKAAGFTLAAVDAGTVINSTSATAITINLPAADTAAGYNVMIIQSGAGAVTINANTNTLNSFGSAFTTAGQHAACSIVRTAASTYNLSGNLV